MPPAVTVTSDHLKDTKAPVMQALRMWLPESFELDIEILREALAEPE